MTETQLWTQVLQTVGGLMLLVTSGLLGWCLREQFRQRADHEALKARVEAEQRAIEGRFLAINDWLKSNSAKLDSIHSILLTESANTHKNMG